MPIALSSHEVEGQRQHNQKNECGYTMVADQKGNQVEWLHEEWWMVECSQGKQQ
jgi:hypothetical protein